jgi:hypothetical protein
MREFPNNPVGFVYRASYFNRGMSGVAGMADG